MAQNKKPSQALRQVSEQEKKLHESFDNDLNRGKAQPYELESRTERLRQFAAERATGFKVADWKGDELLALATLYQFAELFAPAAESYRAYVNTEPKAKKDSTIMSSLVRALIETGQSAEAEKLLDGMELTPNENPFMAISRVALHKDLATAFRDLENYERAAHQARKGYLLADSINFSRLGIAPLQDATERDQMALAALAITSFEREGRKVEADNLRTLIEKYDFKLRPALKSVYEAELAIARLIGKPAPDLAVSRWLDADPMDLAGLHGRVVLLDFWAMWCSPCIAAYPHLLDYKSKYGPKGFEVIGVTRFYGRSDVEDNLARQQEWESLQAYKRKYKLKYPIAAGKMDDVTNDERYGVIAVPTIVLIDRRGNVRHIHRGTGEYRKLEQQIERLLDETP